MRSTLEAGCCLGLVLVCGPAVAGPSLAPGGGAPEAPVSEPEKAPNAAVASGQSPGRDPQHANGEKACDVERIPAASDFESGGGYQRYSWAGSQSLDEVITETLNEIHFDYELAGRPGEFVCRTNFRVLGRFGKGGSTTGYVALQVSFLLDQGPRIAYYVYYVACEGRTMSEEPRHVETPEVREAAERFREDFASKVTSKAGRVEGEAEDD